jgi:acyl-CoA reductase-like NAD-dependent aldehyde dehydrogenase
MYNTILTRRGHSTDLVSLLPGYGETGAALITQGIDKILFIGSPSTGQKVMKTCADHFVPVTLELGGKDPLMIFNDAEFEHAATIAMRAVFWNAGQNCISAERIYVQSGIYDKFVAWVTPRIKALRQGNANEGTFDIGAFGIPQQAKHVQSLVDDAVKRGAKVLVGGKSSEDVHQGFEPTLLANVSHDMKAVKEECFGPVMLLIKFEDEKDLLEGVNSSEFALGASVFTTDYKKADRIARSIHSGMISVNEWGMSALITSLPFGGKKVSGFGRFAGPEGLRDFCHVQSIATDRWPLRTPQPTWLSYPLPSYSPDIMKNAIGILYSHGFSNKMKYIGSVLSLVKDIVLGKKKKE